MSIGSVNVPGSIGAGIKSNTNMLDNPRFQINQRDGKIVKPNVQYFTDIGLTQPAGITSSYMKVIPAGNVWAISVDGSMYYVSGAHVLNGYIGPGYTLDRWKIVGEGTVILNEDGTITLKASNQEMWFVQYFEQYDNQFNSIEMTGSVLVTQITGNGHVLLLHPAGVFGGISGIGIGSYTAVFSEYVEFRIVVPAGCSITIKATKLEFGPIQTLVHKIGDAWVLNDTIPNKALELLKCQRYYRCGRLRFTTVSDDNKLYNPDADLIPVPMRIIPAYNFTNAVNSYGSPVDVTLANVFPANSFAFPTIEVYNPENLPQHITFDYEASTDL